MFILAPSALMTICMLVGILFGIFVQKPISDEVQNNSVCLTDRKQVSVEELAETVSLYSSCNKPISSHVEDCYSEILFYELYDIRIQNVSFGLVAPQQKDRSFQCEMMSALFFRPPPILS
ncbi:MAG: hypothetical protein ACK5MG_04830 [Bacteroidales bacterium]